MKTRSFFDAVKKLEVLTIAILISILIYFAVWESKEQKRRRAVKIFKAVKKLEVIVLGRVIAILISVFVWIIKGLERIRNIKQSKTWKIFIYMVETVNELYLIYQHKRELCKKNLKIHASKIIERNFNFSISVFISCTIMMSILQFTGRMQREPAYVTVGISMISAFFILGILTIAQGLIYSFVRASPRESEEQKEKNIYWDFSKRLSLRAYNIVKEYIGASTLFVFAISVFTILYIFTRNADFLRAIKCLIIAIPTMLGIPLMFTIIMFGLKPTEEEEIQKEIRELRSFTNVKTSGGG